MLQLKCAEIWGGIKNEDLDARSASIEASLYSNASDGGRGGDIYYVSVCGHDMITRIAIADVVGHGQAVSSVSAWLYGALQTHMNGPEGTTLLNDLNTLAVERGLGAMTTIANVAVCKVDDQAYFSYAGHHPVLLRRANASIWQEISIDPEADEIANLPLGVAPQATFHERRLPINKGDRLFLYTDGVIETPDPQGTLFGRQRLLDVLREANGSSLRDTKNAVLDALRAHARCNLAHDDVTLLAIDVR